MIIDVQEDVKYSVRSNWDTVKAMIKGIEYSYIHQMDGPSKYSLDEDVGLKQITSGRWDEAVTAERLANIIGPYVLKRMIECIWASRTNIKVSSSNSKKISSILLYSFSWDKTPEGEAFWDNIFRELEGRGL